MGIIREFRDFAVKGNALDMAVGIIIGGAFGAIVSSLVQNVIMPPIGLLIGGVDFGNLYLNLGPGRFESLQQARDAGAPILAYGAFLQSVVDFVIVAFVIFMMVRTINRLRSKKEEKPVEPPKPSEEIILLREIRDGLKR
jgi:large conductance mechanosensitive channel